MKRLLISLALLFSALASEAQFGTITFNQDTVVIVRRLKIMTLRPGSTLDSFVVHKPNGNIGALHMNQITIPWGNVTSPPTIPTDNNQLTNGMGFISSINSTMVENALGYSPYDGMANPQGFLTSVPAQTWASITGKPTTLAGYGITDAYPLSGNPSSFINQAGARTAISLTTTGSSGNATYNNSTGVLNVPNYTYTPPAWSFNNSPGRSIVTTAAAANGFQISSTRNADVSYSATITTTVSLSGNATGYIVLEICPTNSSTAGDWIEVARVSSGQSGTLVIGLVLNQTGGGCLAASVPAGYYTRLRSVNTTGTPTYTYNSGQEVLK